MKKFIIKITLFLSMITAVLYGSELLVPYYWGAPLLANKIKFYKQHENDFNLLFLGSSHVYRQINPSIFDSLTEGKTESFNFGIPGMGSLETYAFYDNFIEKDISPNTRYVIMELLPIQHIPLGALHSVRTRYYLNYNWYNLATEYLKTASYIEDEAYLETTINNFTTAYMEKIFKVAMLKEMLMYKIDRPEFDARELGKHNDGFYPLEEEMIYKNAANKNAGRSPNNYTPDIKEIKARIEAAKKAYRQNQLPEPNKLLLENLNRFIKISKAQGIHLIFYLPPMLRGYDQYLLPIFNQIDEKHRMDLANPDESSELYSSDIFYDRGHFNDKGSRIFTEKLAHKFNDLF